MSDGTWTRAIPESQLEEGKPQIVTVEDKEVLLVRLGGAIHAVSHECPHYHAPLSKGTLGPASGQAGAHTVTCPWHNARFDLVTGDVLSPPALDNLLRYDVRVEEGTILLSPRKRPSAPPLPEGDKRVFVILGGGGAGAAAAETLRREGFGGRLVIVTREADRPYDRPNLSKEFLSGTARPEWMHLRSEKFYAARRIEVLTRRTAIGLDVPGKSVLLENGEKLGYDKLLLATGTEARKLTVSGANLPGSHTLRSFDDARALVAALAGARRVVIAGASFIGLEAASSLRKRGLEVHVVAPEAAPLAGVFGPRVAARVRSLHEQGGVTFHLERTVKEISGAGRVEKVLLSDGTELPADLVLAGIGVVPSVGYLPGSGLVEEGGIPVGPDLQTKVPGIYAAGDIAVERGARIEHWVVAQTQGQHAARAMLGREVRYAEVPFFWTVQFEQSLKYVGHAPRPESTLYRGDVEKGTFTAGYFGGGRLLAAATMGRTKEITRIQEALRRGEVITPEAFGEGTFSA